MPDREDREVPFTLQLTLIWAVVASLLLWQGLPDLQTSLLDTDDAMRLVQVRELLAGRGWFDLHEVRLGGAAGYDSHWSRLVDGGLAGLYRAFALFTAPDHAELLMRAAWPMLWLGVALAGIMSVSLRLAGENGLFASGFVAALNIPAYGQFSVGRIDHHSVQIALTVLVVAGIVWSDRRTWAAAGAGICAALALAVGLECLPFLAIPAGALVLRFIGDPRHGRALALFCTAFSVSLAALFLGTVSAERLMLTACDTMASNIVLPMVPGGLLLAVVAGTGKLRSASQRLAAVMLLASATLAAVVMLEPRCLSGPFAMVDAAAREQWLNHVKESLPLFTYWGEPTFAVMGIPLLVACAIILPLLLSSSNRRDFVFLTLIVLFLSSALMGFSNTKVTVYAFWFAVPLLAMAATALWSRFGLSRPITRVAIVGLLAPFLYAVLGLLLNAAMAGGQGAPAEDRLCNRTADFRLLSTLQPGLVISDVDSGPFILALTPHSVLAAPYHRLGPQIVLNQRIFDLPPEAARKDIDELGVSYVALCRTGHPQRPGLRHGNEQVTLESTLLEGTPPDWLAPVIGDGGTFLIYRVVRGGGG